MFFVRACDIHSVSNPSLAKGQISIKNTNFLWSTSSNHADATPPAGAASGSSDMVGAEAILQDISLEVLPGQLVIVVGSVGSGKSSLLSALLGEMASVPATGVTLNGSLAISTQKAWIFGGSVRENILFERPLDEQRYEAVLRACQLVPDINAMHAGDQTEIGERGINLSGGQRARVSLARSVYSQATDIYLLDDPLSAVDSVVGRRLFESVIGNQPGSLLSGKTRVLVTHHTHWLPHADQVVVLHAGKVHFAGSQAEFLASGIDLSAMLPKPESTQEESAAIVPASVALPTPSLAVAEAQVDLEVHVSPLPAPTTSSDQAAVDATTGTPATPAAATPDTPLPVADEITAVSTLVAQQKAAGDLANNALVLNREIEKTPDTNRITVAEDKATGAVGSSVFESLMAAGGGHVLASIVIVLVCCGQGLNVSCDYYIAYWSRMSLPDQHMWSSMWPYLILVVLNMFVAWLRAQAFFKFALQV
jgi:ABC-type nitrate/sulfonate/bicarbonate transport system ATPase subunit